MLNNRLLRRTARNSNRGGFTLVELLVVIGIIAILAGVALGPITGAIKKGEQSAGVQTARTLALAEFQYATDNNQVYPYSTTSELIASTLVGAGYVSDPGIFVISGATQTKFTGTAASITLVTQTPPTYSGYAANNVSWDFGVLSSTPAAGLNANVPDETPLVLSDVGAVLVLTGAGPIYSQALTGTSPYGQNGVAICYKSNSAKWLPASQNGANPNKAEIEDASWSGYTVTTVIP
jgi:prepilin-type N-terminal cleavage/methylation domain-containing protein